MSSSSSQESEYQILERAYPGLSRNELRGILNDRRAGALIRTSRPVLRRRAIHSNSVRHDEEPMAADEVNTEVKIIVYKIRIYFW